MLADSGGRNEFHISCLCSSSRSSECTSSYTDWCTMSDCKPHQHSQFACLHGSAFHPDHTVIHTDKHLSVIYKPLLII
jgi:hypothetical protein